MKLQELEIFIVEPPAPGWGGRYWIFTRLRTACGVAGYGECYASAVAPKIQAHIIRDVFERYMEGENPANIEIMFRKTYSSGFTQRPDPTIMGAFSGLEIACWDILGKAYNRPIWALIGGKMNEKIRAYSYLYPLSHHKISDFWISPDMNAEAASEYVKQGYTAVKFDPAGPYTMRGGHQPALSDISLSVAFCKAIREAVGDKADLLFGTHGQFTTAGAIRLGHAIEPYRPLWFEEPIPPDNLAEFSKISQSLRIPIATGERMTTKAEFGEILRNGGAKILQPALGRAGGIWEAKKIAAIAEISNAEMAPHLYAGPVEWAANIHFATSIPNFLICETIDTPFHRALINHSIKIENGFITPPTAPGLGIDFNEELARAHPYTKKSLHLEMQEAPCDYVHGNNFAGGAPPRIS